MPTNRSTEYETGARSSVAVEPWIGEELAGYRIERLLGRGGMGVVYLAEDTRLKRKVALTLVAPDLAADDRFRERVLREAELAASVDHPNVVPVFGAGESDGQLWVATHFVEGDDLASVIGRGGPLEPARALDLCSQIAGALDAARAQGLVQPRLEPSDVLVATEGGREHCCLTGFRLDEHATAAADVRSLGGILFECLAGIPVPVARGEDPPSVWLERPELPEAIDDVVAGAYTYAPRGGYRSCRAYCEAARAALGFGVPWWRSRRALVVGAALVASALAAGLTLSLTRAEAKPVAAGPAAVEPRPGVPLGAHSLVRIDATTGEIVARVAIPFPKLLASDGRSVWVLGEERSRGKLVRVEGATNGVTGIFDADAVVFAPNGLAAAGGSAWLGNDHGEVYRLVAGANAAEPVAFAGPGATPNLASGPVAAAGSIWVSSFPPGRCCAPPPDLHRVDPATGRVIARIDGADRVVASGAGFVWALVADHPDAHADVLVRIDTETHATVPIGALEFLWADFTAADGAVWASSPEDDTIVRLDPVTGEENGRIRVGRAPGALAAAAGAVWAAISDDGTVARYDIADDRIKTIDVGGTPKDLVVVGNSVWVAVAE